MTEEVTPSLLAIIDARAAAADEASPLPDPADVDALAPGDLCAFMVACPLEEAGTFLHWTITAGVIGHEGDVILARPLADIPDINVNRADIFAIESRNVIAIQKANRA